MVVAVVALSLQPCKDALSSKAPCQINRVKFIEVGRRVGLGQGVSLMEHILPAGQWDEWEIPGWRSGSKALEKIWQAHSARSDTAEWHRQCG
jgi:hypothetical protein